MTSKRNKKGRSENPDGQYIPLPYSVLKHPAWRSLSGGAVKVYLELRARYNGKNNGKLSLSIGEGAGLLNMSKTTVSRAFKELEDKGFIVKEKQGNWYGRLATKWCVTDRPCNGHFATRDWQNRKPSLSGKNKTRYSGGT